MKLKAKVLLAVTATITLGLLVVAGLVLHDRHRFTRTRRMLEGFQEWGRATAWVLQEGYFRNNRHHGVHFIQRTNADAGHTLVLVEDAAKKPGEFVCDPWGGRIRYQSPGPVHSKGWDVWSLGPDGRDDRGGGDDLVVGGDLR